MINNLQASSVLPIINEVSIKTKKQNVLFKFNSFKLLQLMKHPLTNTRSAINKSSFKT